MHAGPQRHAPALTAAVLLRLLVVLALSLVVGRALPEERTRLPPSSVVEHQGSLSLYRLEGGVAKALPDGAVAKAGDRVQVVFDAGGRAHGVIFSVDGSGAVTLHHPPRAEGSTGLERNDGPLPRSFVLDAAPSFERFYFVTADAALDPRQVAASAGSGRKPSFLLVK